MKTAALISLVLSTVLYYLEWRKASLPYSGRTFISSLWIDPLGAVSVLMLRKPLHPSLATLLLSSEEWQPAQGVLGVMLFQSCLCKKKYLYMVSHVEWKPGSNSMLVPRFSFLFAWHVVLTFLQLYLTVQKATYSEVHWMLRDSNLGLEVWNLLLLLRTKCIEWLAFSY